jgi:hypothetical protein
VLAISAGQPEHEREQRSVVVAIERREQLVIGMPGLPYGVDLAVRPVWRRRMKAHPANHLERRSWSQPGGNL